jgi:hypothetical protein
MEPLSEEGAISKFNEASLKMIRIHEAQKTLNFLRLNLHYYDTLLGKYNYELMIGELLNLMAEVKSKMSDKEKEEANKWRDKILDMMEDLQIKKRSVRIIKGKVQQWEIFNKERWKILRTKIFELEDFIRQMIENHGLSTFNEETEGIWEM